MCFHNNVLLCTHPKYSSVINKKETVLVRVTIVQKHRYRLPVESCSNTINFNIAIPLGTQRKRFEKVRQFFMRKKNNVIPIT